MEETSSFSKYACVLLFCGLPGSGKSTLVQKLSETSDKNYEKIEVIDYDKLANDMNTFQETHVLSSQESKISHQEISFNSNDLEAWRKSRVVALDNLKHLLYSHFSDASKTISLLLMMDDNFHLKSMRREIYRTCQNIVTEIEATIGFVTLYVSTPTEVCIEQNSRREGKQCVPDDVIRKMAEVMEPPDPTKPYGSFEKFHLTIDCQENEDNASVLQQFDMCSKDAIKSPVPPRTELSAEELAQVESEKARQRDANQKCRLQRLDQLLRKLVGIVGKTDRSKSKIANEARKKIIDRRKTDRLESFNDESLVDDFISLILENNADPNSDSKLAHSIREAYNDLVINKAN